MGDRAVYAAVTCNLAGLTIGGQRVSKLARKYTPFVHESVIFEQVTSYRSASRFPVRGLEARKNRPLRMLAGLERVPSLFSIWQNDNDRKVNTRAWKSPTLLKPTV